MSFLPFDRMNERIQRAKENSDDDYFNTLMYSGEMLTKFVAAGMVAAVRDDRDRQQYRLRYQLVRADGIGDWTRIIDEVLTGVPAQYLIPEAYEEAKQLTQRLGKDTWQYNSVAYIAQCCDLIDPNEEKIQNKVAARNWFSRFAFLRNKTRGHGALPSGKLSKLCQDLEPAINLVLDNLILFQRSWAYLQRTLRGKYRVTRWTHGVDSLKFLTNRESSDYAKLDDGVYINFSDQSQIEKVARVDLIYSDVDSEDFFVPNGGFNGRKFEIISYITGKTESLDAKSYLIPITELPPSETQGRSDIQQHQGSIANLPNVQDSYITRSSPEDSLYNEIVQDNQHRIITLIGRGGIGKTWLALKVLNKIAEQGIFDAILWFSSRDIDLLPDGIKQVKPHVLTENDIAKEFVHLIGPYLLSYDALHSNTLNELEFLRQNMQASELGKILFVFDNFETVKSPLELYHWIDSYLRLPNKAVITTRFREFKGDYPVELRGMSFDEYDRLVNKTSQQLGIFDLLTPTYRDDLFTESEGHPYVVKILLGEVKKLGYLTKIERIIASQTDVLDTLFERTYSRLSLAAQRVFLTLCNWKSLVAQLAIEAVLLRPENEQMDVVQAIEDLHNSSLVEKMISHSDDTIFLSVPLVAMQFGQRKLSVNRMKLAIQADAELLRLFGAAQETDIQRGIAPRVQRLFNNIEQRVKGGSPEKIEHFVPVMRFVAKSYPPAWSMLAMLYDRIGMPEKSEEMLKAYLEVIYDIDEKKKIWLRLANFYLSKGRVSDEIFALFELAQQPEADLEIISYTANRLNSNLRDSNFVLDDAEKRYMVQALIDLLEQRIDEANAIDCSRLAWLYVHYGKNDQALECARRGLSIDQNNQHCLNLLQRFTGNGW